MIISPLWIIVLSIQHTTTISSSNNRKYRKYHFGIVHDKNKSYNNKNSNNNKNNKCNNDNERHNHIFESNYKNKQQCHIENVVLNVRGGGSDEPTNMLPPAIASVIAGSIAGAVGVGVAFPLDKLKTKSQVISTSSNNNDSTTNNNKKHNKKYYFNGGAVAVMAPTVKMSNLRLVKFIWSTEGMKGFFGGVRAAMIGQAMIKAIAFTSNANILKYLKQIKQSKIKNDLVAATQQQPDEFSSLLIAACITGIFVSFVAVPAERIKIIMQAQESSSGTNSDDDDGMASNNKNHYRNELDCLRMILHTEGWSGLCTRGLGTTILREIPSYSIYFVLYGCLKNSKLAKSLGPFAPIILGALSGCASWIPIYPIDVIKTLVQNTDGESSENNIAQVVKQLYKNGGISVFFDGLQPKLMESAVKHAIVFWLYNLIMSYLVVTDH